jgi:hypothetical protein
MKRVGSQKIKSATAIAAIILTTSFTLAPNIASAATVGSGICQQTVDDASDVAVAASGEYCYVAFKAGTRVWTVPATVNTIDYLIVAGGGSGGARHGGGGGAGGLLKSSNIPITNISALNITVGTGGASVIPSGGSNSATGISGNNSTLSKNSGSGAFTTVTAIGGGGGEAGGSGVQSGGSGGGGQYSSGGAGTAGQGYAGGSGGTGTISGATNWWSGGGGGAGAVGGNGSSSGSGGTGGAGAIWVSTFTTTIATALGLAQTNQTAGNQVYFAGGGGGAITLSYTPGSGGLGGGGAAETGNNTGVSGTANSGGGGGGTGCCNGGLTGAGGSGIVLIRYTIPTFSSSAAASFAENASVSTNVLTITVNESSTISLKSTVDYTFFNLVYVDGLNVRLRFTNSPDYEAMSDSGGNNEYDITVRATDANNNYTEFSIKITVTDVVESATINSPSLSASARKGQTVTITIYTNTPGKIRFFSSSKRIPGCLARATSGSYPNYFATCSWSPAVTGNQSIKGTLTPTNGAISASTSPELSLWVLKRAS